ncbi:hypothetical protein OMP38_29135 [Cohnella ginsengisoli]|uniref:LppX_LprAFG lipoprotein n=1 Tax=Cohnella ginsengisoli TaxID=425004 RepID=A0A9X4QQ07_9BACL|nr:DUF6612 family protein [Cohnella ginsengisoli]MDG0794448.1 hypothetical protein [Cohnella ginsengisoli]
MSRTSKRQSLVVVFIVFAVALALTACRGAGPAEPVAAPSAVAEPTETGGAPPSGRAVAGDAAALIEQARAAMSDIGRYAFTLHLVQKLSGGAAADSVFEVNNAGKVERSPLKLDQTIASVQDGEKSSLRAILVPDAYYVYDPSFEEWGKLSSEQAADIARTLSDYQTDPAAALASAASLGAGLSSDSEAGRDVVRYEGKGPEALAFLKHILEGTLDLNSLDEAVRRSIKLKSLSASFTLDAATHLPLAYRVESEMTIEYEPGSPSELSQVFEGTYAKHGATEAIAVPEAALAAPELDPPIDDPAATEGDLGTLDELNGPEGSDSY